MPQHQMAAFDDIQSSDPSEPQVVKVEGSSASESLLKAPTPEQRIRWEMTESSLKGSNEWVHVFIHYYEDWHIFYSYHQSTISSYGQIINSPPPPPILGRRQRDTEEWSPRTKAYLETFAKKKCEIYGVPFREQTAIIVMSQVWYTSL